MHAPVIEIYFDPSGRIGGRDGCFRARLRDAHGCHSAGQIPEEAVESLLRTIKSFQVVSGAQFKGQDAYFGLPLTISAYEIIRLAPYAGMPLSCAWNARFIAQEVDDVQAQRTASSMVAYMLYGPLRNRQGYKS